MAGNERQALFYCSYVSAVSEHYASDFDTLIKLLSYLLAENVLIGALRWWQTENYLNFTIMI